MRKDSVSVPFPEEFKYVKYWISILLKIILDCFKEQARKVLEASMLELRIALS